MWISLMEKGYPSAAKVKQYDEHKANLKTLRHIMKKYCDKKIWDEFFNDRSGKDDYAAYIGHVRKNGEKYDVKRCENHEDSFY